MSINFFKVYVFELFTELTTIITYFISELFPTAK